MVISYPSTRYLSYLTVLRHEDQEQDTIDTASHGSTTEANIGWSDSNTSWCV